MVVAELPQPQAHSTAQSSPEAKAPTPHSAESLQRPCIAVADRRCVLPRAETVPEFFAAARPPCCAFHTAPEFPPATSSPAALKPPASALPPAPAPRQACLQTSIAPRSSGAAPRPRFPSTAPAVLRAPTRKDLHPRPDPGTRPL